MPVSQRRLTPRNFKHLWPTKHGEYNRQHRDGYKNEQIWTIMRWRVTQTRVFGDAAPQNNRVMIEALGGRRDEEICRDD
jgi:hypothetical protein